MVGHTASLENLSHSAYHNIFSGPLGFAGLSVLVEDNNVELPVEVIDPLLLGQVAFRAPGDCDGDGKLDGSLEECMQDTDNSGDVRVPDLIVLLGCWGQIKAEDPECLCLDSDGDGQIRVPDLITLLGVWGVCP